MLKGLCYICTKPSMQTCIACGRIICNNCSVNGLCINCRRSSKI